MSVRVKPIVFDCEGQQLVGNLHEPAEPRTRGVLIVVGGPQYRIGAHRQFLLLARQLSAAGFPVMRFDYRGMGDSDGENLGFENIQADLGAAADTFVRQCPQVKELVIWGLCDAASAALFYVNRDPRIAGLVLLNPWVRTEQSLARSYLKEYYLARLFQRGFWQKLLAGRFRPVQSLRGLFETWRTGASRQSGDADAATLPGRMRQGLAAFDGPVLIALSENDLTAGEFRDQAGSEAWQSALARPNVQIESIAGADHTFSRAEWRERVAHLSLSWLEGW